MDKDILKARKQACELFLQESKRLKQELEDTGNDETRLLGLRLYYTVRNNKPLGSEENVVKQFYLLDGEDLPQSMMLNRLDQEYFHLLEAGLEFDSVEVELGGKKFNVALGGLFSIEY